MRRGVPLAERSMANVIWMFMILPIIAGAAILVFAVVNVVANGREFTAADWLWQVGWFGLLGLGLMTAFPIVGWRELRRRRKRA
jgi:uncharacterized integral membrane protein